MSDREFKCDDLSIENDRITTEVSKVNVARLPLSKQVYDERNRCATSRLHGSRTEHSSFRCRICCDGLSISLTTGLPDNRHMQKGHVDKNGSHQSCILWPSVAIVHAHGDILRCLSNKERTQTHLLSPSFQHIRSHCMEIHYSKLVR